MLKKFLMRRMMKSQLKGVPEAEQERMLKIVENNPELFQKMAVEIQDEVKAGKDQVQAAQTIALKYQKELMEAMK